MDAVSSIASSMALTSVGSQVAVGVLSATENLQQDLVSRLFSSLGIGNGIDAYA
jgi:hypothetical protein